MHNQHNLCKKEPKMRLLSILLIFLKWSGRMNMPGSADYESTCTGKLVKLKGLKAWQFEGVDT